MIYYKTCPNCEQTYEFQVTHNRGAVIDVSGPEMCKTPDCYTTFDHDRIAMDAQEQLHRMVREE